METEKRLDAVLVERGFFESRTRAQAAIAEGRVSINGKPAQKSSAKISHADILEVAQQREYVGRGAYKLLAAIDAFSPEISGKACLDVGASTGGFTEVWLEKGAAHVFAVDVGRDQLVDTLRKDPRVTSLEKTDIRELDPVTTESALLCSVDVSFISLSKILASPAVMAVYARGGRVIALVKPQFEAGKAALDKHGVVKKAADHVRVLESVTAHARSLGYKISGLIPSPIAGGDGNREYLMYLSDTEANLNFQELVNRALTKK